MFWRKLMLPENVHALSTFIRRLNTPTRQMQEAALSKPGPDLTTIPGSHYNKSQILIRFAEHIVAPNRAGG